MVDERFSAKAFEDRGLDSEAARKLADLLAEEIQQELYDVISPKFLEIIERLNGLGHNLRPYEKPEPGDISFRDDSETDSGYQCKLRVAFDSVISTGYAHLIDMNHDKEA